MMDDIAESQDLSKEISEAISNPVAFGADVDEVRKNNVPYMLTINTVNSLKIYYYLLLGRTLLLGLKTFKWFYLSYKYFIINIFYLHSSYE